MGSEASLWQTVKRNLKAPSHRLQRIESSTAEGIPDVYMQLSGISNWTELKHRHTWPKRATTVVRLSHYTDVQRDWLGLEGACGGLAWLLLQVEKDYLLFDWAAAQSVGYLTKELLFTRACATWHGQLNGQELTRALRGGR